MLPESLLELPFLLVYVLQHVSLRVRQVSIYVLAQLRDLLGKNCLSIFKTDELLFHLVDVVQVS